MKNLGLTRYVLAMGAFAALLAGCSGSQPPVAAPNTMRQSGIATVAAENRGAWMAPDAKARNLLYVASGDIVDVYTYPEGKLIGSLGSFANPGGLCVNKAGDVFVPVFGDSKVYEYAHGGTKQIAALNSPYSVNACAVDPKTQNLAAASYFGAIIFPYSRAGRYRFAKYYRDPVVYFGAYCTYDGRGNLFLDGSVSGPDGFALSELQRGSKTFVLVTLNQNIHGPGAMQWRSNILTIADRGKYNGPPKRAIIYRFTIDDNAGAVVGKTNLKGSTDYAQLWIQGKTVIGPEAGSQAGIGLWNYPRGGAPAKTITGSPPYGATVSLK